MTKIKKEMLISAIEELNVLLFDPANPQIDTEQEPEKLMDGIREAMELFEPEDIDLTDGTIETLQKVLEISDASLSAKTKATLQELGIWRPGEKPEEEPEVEDVKSEDATVKETDLVSQIQNAPRLRDLKTIAKAHNELKSVRSEMSRHKTADDLRKVMLEVLRKDVQEEFKPESKTVPEKVPEKKEVKQKQIVEPKKEDKKADKRSERTYAQIFAEIFHENVPRTVNELVDEVVKRYHSGSVAGAKTFVQLYVQILNELGLIVKNDKGQFIKGE